MDWQDRVALRRHIRMQMVQRGLLSFCDDAPEPPEPQEVTEFTRTWPRIEQLGRSLIKSGVTASTTDHELQSIENTTAPDSEFWSSSGTLHQATEEGLLYMLSSPLCCVQHVTIAIYRAHYQHGDPLYPPEAVSFMVGPSPTQMYSASPKYPCKRTEDDQVFQLNCNVPLGGYLLVRLHGKLQQQWEDMQYYIAVRHVAAHGYALSPCDLPSFVSGLSVRPGTWSTCWAVSDAPCSAVESVGVEDPSFHDAHERQVHERQQEWHQQQARLRQIANGLWPSAAGGGDAEAQGNGGVWDADPGEEERDWGDAAMGLLGEALMENMQGVLGPEGEVETREGQVAELPEQAAIVQGVITGEGEGKGAEDGESEVVHEVSYASGPVAWVLLPPEGLPEDLCQHVMTQGMAGLAAVMSGAAKDHTAPANMTHNPVQGVQGQPSSVQGPGTQTVDAVGADDRSTLLARLLRALTPQMQHRAPRARSSNVAGGIGSTASSTAGSSSPVTSTGTAGGASGTVHLLSQLPSYIVDLLCGYLTGSGNESITEDGSSQGHGDGHSGASTSTMSASAWQEARLNPLEMLQNPALVYWLRCVGEVQAELQNVRRPRQDPHTQGQQERKQEHQEQEEEEQEEEEQGSACPFSMSELTVAQATQGTSRGASMDMDCITDGAKPAHNSTQTTAMASVQAPSDVQEVCDANQTTAGGDTCGRAKGCLMAARFACPWHEAVPVLFELPAAVPTAGVGVNGQEQAWGCHGGWNGSAGGWSWPVYEYDIEYQE